MRGRRWSSRLGTLWVLPGETASSRLCLVFPKRLGTAVKRNRGRRRVQEIFRAIHPRQRGSWDLVFRAQPPLFELAQPALVRELEELWARAGLLEPTDAASR